MLAAARSSPARVWARVREGSRRGGDWGGRVRRAGRRHSSDSVMAHRLIEGCHEWLLVIGPAAQLFERGRRRGDLVGEEHALRQEEPRISSPNECPNGHLALTFHPWQTRLVLPVHGRDALIRLLGEARGEGVDIVLCHGPVETVSHRIEGLTVVPELLEPGVARDRRHRQAGNSAGGARGTRGCKPQITTPVRSARAHSPLQTAQPRSTGRGGPQWVARCGGPVSGARWPRAGRPCRAEFAWLSSRTIA